MSVDADPVAEATEFVWTGAGEPIGCGVTRLGAGETALLLPALSSISTRREMWPLQQRLARRFATIAVDWPGFGTEDKPRRDWTSAALAQFLADVLRELAPRPALIVAAGHAAGYVLRHFASAPEEVSHLALVAPTWRGPLPTMMGRRPAWLRTVRAAMDRPVLGPALYALNLNDVVIRAMAREHVYSDRTWLDRSAMDDKRRVAQARGARFASVRFVTGALDPFESSAAFQAAAAAIPPGRLGLVWGAETPPKSKAEMGMLAAAAQVSPTVLPHGKLGVHEEFAAEVAEAILSGLDEASELAVAPIE